jgi:hypothetical protein
MPALEDSGDFRTIRREISPESSPAIFPITVHPELKKVFWGEKVAFSAAAAS